MPKVLGVTPHGSSSITRPAIIGDSLIIFGFAEGFTCLNINTGATKWISNLGIGLHASNYWMAMDMIIENGRIYTLAGNDALRGSIASAVCISVDDGHLIWRHDLEQEERFAWRWCKYSASSDAIFYATMSSHVVALSKADGSILWDSPNGSIQPLWFEMDQGSPSYRNGVVYVGSGMNMADGTLEPDGATEDGGITALDAKTGNVLWQKIIPLADSSSGYPNPKLLNDNQLSVPPLPTDDGIIITPGFCVALMDTTGKIVWMKAPSATGALSIYTWQPFLSNGQLYGFNSGNAMFFAFSLDPHSGAVHWARNVTVLPASNGFNTPVMDSGILYVISEAACLFAQSTIDGSLVYWTPLMYYDAPLGQFLVKGKRVYYQTNHNLVCLEHK